MTSAYLALTLNLTGDAEARATQAMTQYPLPDPPLFSSFTGVWLMTSREMTQYPLPEPPLFSSLVGGCVTASSTLEKKMVAKESIWDRAVG